MPIKEKIYIYLKDQSGGDENTLNDAKMHL